MQRVIGVGRGHDNGERAVIVGCGQIVGVENAVFFPKPVDLGFMRRVVKMLIHNLEIIASGGGGGAAGSFLAPRWHYFDQYCTAQCVLMDQLA